MTLDINKDAPKLAALGVTEGDIETAAAKRPQPAPVESEPSDYTKEDAIAIADAWYERGCRPPSTGLNEWATERGITLDQVREIVAELESADSALSAVVEAEKVIAK